MTTRILQRLLLCGALVGALATAGCGSGDMHAEVTGSLIYGSCGEVLPWSPRDAVWLKTGEAGGLLRFQSTLGAAAPPDDTLTFVIDDHQSLADTLGQAIDVGDRFHTDVRASGSATFLERCPDERTLAVQLHGTLNFEAFNPSPGGRIAGHFDGTALDARTGESLSDGLRVDFDFEPRERVPW